MRTFIWKLFNVSSLGTVTVHGFISIRGHFQLPAFPVPFHQQMKEMFEDVYMLSFDQKKLTPMSCTA
ncbi:hypothetical protein D5086_014939 [Populus alba]|uniref:Uncharacterized protein n=2 Tax=Populus alba TaxID=43335 RepID=A0ACC4C0Q9_POPAL